MRKEFLAQEFVEVHDDCEKYISSVLNLLQNPALEYLIAGIIEKTERKMEVTFELKRNGMSAEEAFRIYKDMDC